MTLLSVLASWRGSLTPTLNLTLKQGRSRAGFLLIFIFFNVLMSIGISQSATAKQPEGPFVRSPAQQHERNINISINCEDLLPGQYYCEHPQINSKTQQPANCSRETRSAPVACYPVQGIVCNGQNHTGFSVGFYKHVSCKWTNGHSFSVALLLSVFLGMFGVDRFYLGYPAIGLLKLCTLGFMFLGQLVDILLIALQVVGPSDKSDYVIDYYGPGLTYIGKDNFTYIQPHYEH